MKNQYHNNEKSIQFYASAYNEIQSVAADWCITIPMWF